MSMRWISEVPSKMVKIAELGQFPQVSGGRGAWYQHGSSTGFPKVATVAGHLPYVAEHGHTRPRKLRRLWRQLSAESCSEVHRRYVFALTCQ
jgi:hypothetical protein